AIDTSLQDQAQSLLAGLQVANGSLSLQGGESLPGETSEGIAVGVILEDAHGKMLDRSGAAPSAAAGAPVASAALRTRTAVTATVTDAGHAARVLAQPAAPGGGPVVGVLAVTRPVQELHETLFVLALLLAGSVTLLVVVVSSLAWLLAGRALRPVRQIAATARDLSEHDLH